MSTTALYTSTTETTTLTSENDDDCSLKGTSTTTENAANAISSSEEIVDSLSDDEEGDDYFDECELNETVDDGLVSGSERLVIGATNQQRPKLCLDGFFYTIDRKNDNNSKCFWKCKRTGNRSIPKCY